MLLGYHEREKGIQLSSLLFSFHTEKESLNPPSNVNAFEVYCSICPHGGVAGVLDAARVLNPKRVKNSKQCERACTINRVYRSSPTRDLARRRKKSMTFLAAPELPG